MTRSDLEVGACSHLPPEGTSFPNRRWSPRAGSLSKWSLSSPLLSDDTVPAEDLDALVAVRFLEIPVNTCINESSGGCSHSDGLRTCCAVTGHTDKLKESPSFRLDFRFLCEFLLLEADRVLERVP
jgi:hypothetical protein